MSDDHLQQFPPVFASNRPDRAETVAGEVNRLFKGSRENLADVPDVSIATAYLNAAGFVLLGDELEQAPHVRLLLGAEPNAAVDHALSSLSARGDDKLDQALTDHEQWIEAERDLMGFDLDNTAAAKRLVAWLQATDEDGNRRVQVRRYTEGFLHGKAFLVEHAALPGALAGSSNMTYAGLMKNAELNLGYPMGASTYVGLIREWFDQLWAQSDSYPLDEVYAAQWKPHSPYVVFMRMLHELYADSLEDETSPRTELNLTGFQLDGVARMTRLLDSLGGVLVADEVGLGKTYLAGEVIARASTIDRQDVLIVCPAALKDGMWEPFLKKEDFSRRVDVMSFDELRLKSDPDHPEHDSLRRALDRYALVVIDEAHNLRNPQAQRSAAVNALVTGTHPKKLVLLTATPVNNSLMDLYTLVSYFVRNDAAFAGNGIPSIRGYIQRAQDMDPESLSPEHLFDLMDEVAVRRTRRFVQRNYQNETIVNADGTRSAIRFPTPEPQRLDYALDSVGEDLLTSTVYALDLPDSAPLISTYHDRQRDPGRLMLSRYAPSAYRITSNDATDVVEAYQISNVGLLRSALLKRLESSPAALNHTLETLINSHTSFLAALDQGWVLTGSALREWVGSEADDIDEWVADLDGELQHAAEESTDYHAEALRSDIADDLELLKALKSKAELACESDDPKVERLITELRAIAKAARTPAKSGLSASSRRKGIVFSIYADTIDSIAKRVTTAINDAPDDDPLSDYQNRVAPDPIKGSKAGVDQAARARVIARFAPETAGPLNEDGTPQEADRYDLLFTTDVLSEGVNLQQAGRIINYDLPWNPMRLVQRHGRIDRIGSKHARVTLGCFFPAEHLDDLLHLEETLQRKLAYADAAVGTGKVLPGFNNQFEVNLKDTREQIESIRSENPEIFENRGSSSAAVSGEEYRRRLNQAMQDPAVKHDVERLPWMSGSGFINPKAKTTGYVFCMKMGDHPKPWYRFVPTQPGTWEPIKETAAPNVGGSEWQDLDHHEDIAGEAAQPQDEVTVVVDDTLTCLLTADPEGPDTPRHLSEAAYLGAFTAWQAARNQALEDWLQLTDPNNLRPEVPKALRDAAKLVYQSGGDALNHQDQQDLLGRLSSSPPHRVQRDIRQALNRDATDAHKIQAIYEIIKDAGVVVPEPAEPLPHLEPTDVHLIAWMAVNTEDQEAD